ncbi:bile acid:sodium symporter family protein [Thermobacillus composti]|nr:bile acid:sodium symporter [Thermobacillus composti]
MSLLTPGALFLGFLCSDALLGCVPLVPWLFAYITFAMGLGIRAQEVKLAFTRPLPMLAALAAAHVLMPLAAWGTGTALFGAESPYVVGFVLLMLIPLGISSLMWVGVSGGLPAVITALVTVSSLLSPLIVPLGLDLMFGAAIEMDTRGIMLDLLLIVVLPTAAGIALNEVSRGRAAAVLQPAAGFLSKLAFLAVIVLNAAAIGPHVHALGGAIPALLPAVVLLVAIGYAAGYAAALPWRSAELTTTLAFGCGIRNVSLGIVIGLGYFRPEAAVPVVLSILIQQPGAALFRSLLRKIYERWAGRKASGGVTIERRG